MSASREVIVEFIGRDKGLNSTVDGTGSKMSKLGSVMANVGKIAAVGLAVGVVAAGAALVSMTKAAIEDQASQAKLANILKNTTGATDAQVASVEDWISAQGTALGVTDDELRPALEKLVIATGDVGEAQKLASLAMDASAGSGKSLESVSKALAMAHNGNTGALGKLGIATKDAAGNALTFEQITAKMGDTFAGAAATKANTLEGKMGRLKLIFDETKETIGAKLIPVITQLADWFLVKALPAITKFGGYLGEVMPPIFDKIQSVIQKVFGNMGGDVGGPLSTVMGIITSFISLVTTAWGLFGNDIIDYVKKAFNNALEVISGVLSVIQGVIKVVTGLIKGDWGMVWDGIKDIVGGAWRVIHGLVSQALNVLSTIMSLAWTAIKAVVSGAWEGIKSLVSAGVGKLVDYVQGIPGRFRGALSDLGETLRNIFDNAMTAGLNKVQNIGGDIVGWIKGIPGKLLDKLGDFKDAGRSLIGGFVDGMKGAAGLVSDIAGNVWNAVKGLLNDGIDKVNNALEFTIKLPAGLGSFGINPANIPHLATGGVVRARPGGVLALIGEGGHDEAVVPLSGPNAPRMGSASGAASGGAQTVVVDLKLDGRTMEKLLIQFTRDAGRPLQVQTLGV